MGKTYRTQARMPQGYDSAMGFLNKKESDHSTPKLGLDAMKDHGKGTLGFTSDKILGGSSSRIKGLSGTSAAQHSLNKDVSQWPSFAGDHPSSQVPNAGKSPSKLTTSRKVQMSVVTKKGESEIF